MVLAEPLSTKDTADAFEHEGSKPEDYVGMDTNFQVRCCLKGDCKKSNLTVLHFRYSTKGPEIVDGALFVHFQLKGRSFVGRIMVDRGSDSASPSPAMNVSKDLGKPDYLLFLKLRKDGRFEPLSGQYDSSLSCREVSAADTYFGHADGFSP